MIVRRPSTAFMNVRTTQSFVFKVPYICQWLSTRIGHYRNLFAGVYDQLNKCIFHGVLSCTDHLVVSIARVTIVLHSSLFAPRITINIKGAEYGI